jgi:hypothetical protein
LYLFHLVPPKAAGGQLAYCRRPRPSRPRSRPLLGGEQHGDLLLLLLNLLLLLVHHVVVVHVRHLALHRHQCKVLTLD